MGSSIISAGPLVRDKWLTVVSALLRCDIPVKIRDVQKKALAV